jgi:hypothetical protein
LQNRWNALVTDAQQRALRALQAKTGVTLTRPMKDAFTKAVELERLGALNSEQFYDVVKKALKLKQLTEADAKVLRKLVQRAHELPEGFLREQAAADVIQFTRATDGQQALVGHPDGDVLREYFERGDDAGEDCFREQQICWWQYGQRIPEQARDEFAASGGFRERPGGRVQAGLVKGGLQAQGMLRTGVLTGRVATRPD